MLIQKLLEQHAFWSFGEVNSLQISDEVLIEKVLLHLDIDDSISLFQLFPKRKIQRVWKDCLLSQEPMYHGLNRLICFSVF